MDLVTEQVAELEVSTPVSAKRLHACLHSAQIWVDELPKYAEREQKKGDAWSITSGLLAALTSLSIWPVMTEQSGAWVKALVSAVALLAAACALVPRVMNYGEMAGQARELASLYGEVVGSFIDLVASQPPNQQDARRAVNKMQAAKAKKDMLRRLPSHTEIERDLEEAHRQEQEKAARYAEGTRRDGLTRLHATGRNSRQELDGS